MSKKIGVLNGSPTRCPDCGENTIFHVGNILNETKEENSILDQEVLDRLRLDSYECKFCCSVCNKYDCSKLYWIDIGNNKIGGPFCNNCFEEETDETLGGDQGLTKDVKIYFIRANESSRAALKAVREHSEKQTKKEEIISILKPETKDLF